MTCRKQLDLQKCATPATVELTDDRIERTWQFLHDEEGNPPDQCEFARAIITEYGSATAPQPPAVPGSGQSERIAEQALNRILEIVRSYLPPDGLNIRDAMSKIISVIDPWPLGNPPQADQEPMQHDEDLLERLFWEMDSQRRKTGDERMAFKGKMRFYASEFRTRSSGRMAYAPSVSDDMMNLADRLGSEFDNLDPIAWRHLLVYAPQQQGENDPRSVAKVIGMNEDGPMLLWHRAWTDFPKGTKLYIQQQPRHDPQFDASSVDQERLAVQFCAEIAGPRGGSPSLPDPVRLLEMAEALYQAEIHGVVRQPKGEKQGKQKPVAWIVWWGIGEMRPHERLFKTKEEAEAFAREIKSNTEVRPIVYPCEQPKRDDVLLQVIQRLNQNPYSLTKWECIDLIKAMRANGIRGEV